MRYLPCVLSTNSFSAHVRMLETKIIHLLIILSGLTGLLITVFYKPTIQLNKLYLYNRFSSVFDILFGSLNLIGYNYFTNTYLTKLYDLMIVYIIVNCLSLSLHHAFKIISYAVSCICIIYHCEFYSYIFLIILLNFDFFRGRAMFSYHKLTTFLISVSLIIQAFSFLLTIQNSIELKQFSYYLIYLNIIYHFLIRTFMIKLKR